MVEGKSAIGRLASKMHSSDDSDVYAERQIYRFNNRDIEQQYSSI